MNLLDALAIVRDLANENILEDFYCDDEGMREIRRKHLKAVKVVDAHLESLRGEGLEYPCGHLRVPGDDICGSMNCNDDLLYS